MNAAAVSHGWTQSLGGVLLTLSTFSAEGGGRWRGMGKELARFLIREDNCRQLFCRLQTAYLSFCAIMQADMKS